MAKNPAFQFYASDFLTDTNAWDAIETGIYIRLLATQWVNGFLPNDTKRLARISGVEDGIFEKAWVIVGFKFGLAKNNQLFNKKLEEIRATKLAFIEKQAENGKKGGRPSKKAVEEPIENPSLSSGLTQTISQKKPIEEEVEIEEEIEKEVEGEKAFGNAPENPGIDMDRTKFFIPQLMEIWKLEFDDYPEEEEKDFSALNEISKFIKKHEKIPDDPISSKEAAGKIKLIWEALAKHVASHSFFRKYSLMQVSKHIQSIIQDFKNEQRNPKTGNEGTKSGRGNAQSFHRAINGGGIN